MEPIALQQLLSQADQCRQAQQWLQAIGHYRKLATQLAGVASFHHNLALCLLGAGQAEDALVQADLALAQQPGLWQSAVVKVRALSQLGRPLEAASLLEQLRQSHPEQAQFSLELATIVLHDECNPRRARALVQPFLTHPDHAADATLTDLVASLYDRDEPATALNQRIGQFADKHLNRSNSGNSSNSSNSSNHSDDSQAITGTRHSRARVNPEFTPEPLDAPLCGHDAPQVPFPTNRQMLRLRIGLLSPHFNCSPVFFFCSGALRLLSQQFDLYFFSRNHREDWATEQLHVLATAWHDVTDLTADQLDAFLRQHALDVLIDLGGWMDPIALKGISTKPARRMYKWVGGQSVTTGLRAFDGFITDLHQTPPGSEVWYTEPLLRLPNGYVTYTPPHYLPPPEPASQIHCILGVVANPTKVSQAFLAELSTTLQTQPITPLPIKLRFIDKRYQHPALQGRIRSALQAAQLRLGNQLAIEFVVPSYHLDYLRAVAQLTEVADTFPYTGGLTTMEALSLGVVCGGRAGELFCERHTHAHLHSLHPRGAKRKPLQLAQAGTPRHSLVPPDSPRLNHAALAESLAQLLSHGSVNEVTA